jgi:hypothetical protein
VPLCNKGRFSPFFIKDFSLADKMWYNKGIIKRDGQYGISEGTPVEYYADTKRRVSCDSFMRYFFRFVQSEKNLPFCYGYSSRAAYAQRPLCLHIPR